MKTAKWVKRLFRLAPLVLLLPASSLRAQTPDSTAISKLLSSVKTHASLADDDASTLEAHSRSNLDWRVQSRRLNMMRDHVNNLIRDANELATLRGEGSPWQQEAVDRVTELLPEMASHLTAMLNHFNQNLDAIHLKPYRNLVVQNKVIIHKAHEIISDFVDYGEAKAKADALEKELQVSAGPGADESV